MVIQEGMSIQRKLEILSMAARYDVACTSSGVDRKGNKTGIGNSLACGICHTFSADGRCISLLKILFTNECIFDCKYCINRSSNDIVRASFTPREVCELTMEFYRRNYIEGLFLSSGIKISPNHTMEQIYETLRMLRDEYDFNGYIHCKIIPGTDPVLIEAIGWYADRLSCNLELPTAESLKKLAPHKNRKNILKPMRQIQLRRDRHNEYLGIDDTGRNLNLLTDGKNNIVGIVCGVKVKPEDVNNAIDYNAYIAEQKQKTKEKKEQNKNNILGKCVHSDGICRKQMVFLKEVDGYRFYAIRNKTQNYDKAYVQINEYVYPICSISRIDDAVQEIKDKNIDLLKWIEDDFNKRMSNKMQGVSIGVAEMLGRKEEAIEHNKILYEIRNAENELVKEHNKVVIQYDG